MSEAQDTELEAYGASPLTLEIDCGCRVCGYNLRGLAGDGCCPECGEPIAESLKAQRYWGANPAWMKTLAKGTDMVTWSTILLIILPFFGCAFGVLVSPLAFGGYIVMGVLALWYAGMWGLALAGTWLLTSREIDGLAVNDYPWLRWLARLGFIAGPGLFALLLISEGLALMRGHDHLLGVLALLSWGGIGTGLIGQALVVARLSGRAKDRHLHDTAWAMVCIVCFALLLIAVLFVPMFFSDRYKWQISDAWPVILCGLGVLLVGGVVVHLLLLNTLRSQVRMPKRDLDFGVSAM